MQGLHGLLAKGALAQPFAPLFKLAAKAIVAQQTAEQGCGSVGRVRVFLIREGSCPLQPIVSWVVDRSIHVDKNGPPLFGRRSAPKAKVVERPIKVLKVDFGCHPVDVGCNVELRIGVGVIGFLGKIVGGCPMAKSHPVVSAAGIRVGCIAHNVDRVTRYVKMPAQESLIGHFGQECHSPVGSIDKYLNCPLTGKLKIEAGDGFGYKQVLVHAMIPTTPWGSKGETIKLLDLAIGTGFEKWVVEGA